MSKLLLLVVAMMFSGCAFFGGTWIPYAAVGTTTYIAMSYKPPSCEAYMECLEQRKGRDRHRIDPSECEELRKAFEAEYGDSQH